MTSSVRSYSSFLRNANPLPDECSYVRFGDKDVITGIKQEIKENPNAVIDRIKEFVRKYFDQEDHKKIARVLLDLIKADKSINEHNRSLIVNPGFTPALPEEFLKDDTDIYFYNFLIGVWFYVYMYSDKSEEGRATIENLTDEPKGENSPRPPKKNIDDNLGFEGIHISYDTEKEYNDGVKVVEEKEDGPMIISPKGNAPDLATFDPEDDNGVVVLRHVEVEKTVEDRFSHYVSKSAKEYGQCRGFLDIGPRPFRDFYVCGNVKCTTPIRYKGNFENFIGTECDGEIEYITVDDLNKTFCVFTGNGGAGKSMLLRKFFLDEAERYKPGRRVPIMVSLRAYKPDEKSLEFLLFRELKMFDSSLELTDLYHLLDTGRAVCLLDGLDEIDRSRIPDFLDELDFMRNGRADTYFIMSARKIPEVHTINNALEYEVCNLTMPQASELIQKLNPAIVDAKLKKDFIERLEKDAFHFNRDERRDYVGNPLFLSLMVRTFDLIHDIPTDRYVFYEKTYTAMASEYDSKTKRMSRTFFTGLGETKYKKYFSEFCGLSYVDRNYEFSRELILDYFTQIVEDHNLDIEPELFIKDAKEIICLMYEDGQVYAFVHRSFQEYFAAVYYLSLLSTEPGTVQEILEGLDNQIKNDETLSMMYGMGDTAIEKYIILPFLEKMFIQNNDEDDYKAYLSEYYSGIEYVTGDLDEDMCNNDDQASAIFWFVKQQFDIDYKYLSIAFDSDETFADDMTEYFWIEETWLNPQAHIGNMRLVTINEIPKSYLDENGYDTPYDIEADHGYLCSVDIDKALKHPEHNEAVYDILMDDEFPLKEQFFKFKELYVKLKGKYDNAPKKKFGLRKG